MQRINSKPPMGQICLFKRCLLPATISYQNKDGSKEHFCRHCAKKVDQLIIKKEVKK